MDPTVKIGDVVLIDTYAYGFGRAPETGDVVLFRWHTDGQTFDLPPLDRDIPRVIAWRLFLLVGVLMFFINDNEAERLNRSEYRRTSSNHDSSSTLAYFVPFVVALTG